MEELNLDYEIKFYKRTPLYVAPKELLEVWPTGMSPVLQIFEDGSTEPITLAESGHIISYLINNYDKEGKLTPATAEGKRMVDYYLHFAEGSLQPYLVSLLVGHLAGERSPWGVLFFVRQVMGKINSEYYGKRLITNLHFLDSQLEKKGGGYFVGDKLTGADIILDFPINDNIFGNKSRASMFGIKGTVEELFPNLAKWHKLTLIDPLRLKAVALEKSKL